MNRATARGMWKALSDAHFDRETLLWVANVATDILRADDAADDNTRRAAVLRAVGLSGRYDTERERIKDIVSTVDFHCALIERGSRWSPARPLAVGERSARRREAVAQALRLDLTPDAIDKRIKRALED